MNEKALFDLTYGLFLVGSKADGKENACVVNTVIQVAGNPTRLAVCCINGNLTPKLIERSGYCSVTILDQTVPFSVFERFGLTHGTDTDKFAGYDTFHDVNGMPYIKDHACAVLSLKIVESHDLGSHTMLIGELVDAEKLSSERPVTYAEYHSRIKPRQQIDAARKIVGWRCKICGYVYEGAELPADFLCPLCQHPASDFEPIYE